MAYHISKDGVARQCRAKSPESCTATPADQKEHYDSKEDAQTAYENKQAKNTFKPLKNSVERDILLSDRNTLKKTGVNAYANLQEKDELTQEKRQSSNNLRALNKSLREANYELIELEDKYETAWNDRRKEIEIEIADKKAAIKEIEQQVKEAKSQKDTSKPMKRNSLDIAADHLQTSQQIEELIDYNNSNRKKDFVFKHNDPSYAEKTPKEQGKFLIDLVNKEDTLKKEFNDSKAKNKDE